MYFFFNDTATTEIYTLSLHDALPISAVLSAIKRREYDGYHYEAADASLALLIGRTTGEAKPLFELESVRVISEKRADGETTVEDRKSTRLNSSYANISYAVFCLKKKTT